MLFSLHHLSLHRHDQALKELFRIITTENFSVPLDTASGSRPEKMYWELWLSQVTASAALQCMLVQNKGGEVLCVDVVLYWTVEI